MSDCKHEWGFQGVVYWTARHFCPGSGAHPRVYADRYFCKHCLEQRSINERESGDTYSKALEGAMPR